MHSSRIGNCKFRILELIITGGNFDAARDNSIVLSPCLWCPWCPTNLTLLQWSTKQHACFSILLCTMPSIGMRSNAWYFNRYISLDALDSPTHNSSRAPARCYPYASQLRRQTQSEPAQVMSATAILARCPHTSSVWFASEELLSLALSMEELRLWYERKILNAKGNT